MLDNIELPDYKEDLRIVRTRKLLYKSLFDLMETTPFEKITVMEICKKAMVHRATFYNHFEDKEHLLEFAIDEIKEALFNATIQNEDFHSPKEMYKSLLSKSIDFIEEYKDRLLLIIKQNNKEKIYGLIQSTIKRSMRYLTSKNEYKINFTLPKNIIIDFLSGGITNLILSQIESPDPYKKEELLKYLNVLLDERIYLKK